MATENPATVKEMVSAMNSQSDKGEKKQHFSNDTALLCLTFYCMKKYETPVIPASFMNANFPTDIATFNTA